MGGSLNSNTIKYYSKIKNLSSFIKKMETRKVIFNTKVFLNKRTRLKKLYILKKDILFIKKKSMISDLDLIYQD